MFNKCFPQISVRISSRDPPFISPLVKHLLKFRNRLQKRSKPLPVGLEDRINHLIRENQRQAIMHDSCMSGARMLGGLLSIPSLEEIPSPSRLVQSSILTLSMNTFVI